MKVKHLFYATACLMALAACNNEEFPTSESSFDGKGELVQLNGAAIALTKGEAQTRAIDADGKFQWMPSGTLGQDEIPEKIGLCWTGVNNVNPDKAPATATGSMVYTNYEFVQAGWLYEGEKAPQLNPCTPYNVKNGEYNTAANIGSDGTTADCTTDPTTYKATAADKTLSLKTGFFNTKNTAIYSGEYIVYYPYNEEFFDSPIVASAPRAVELAPDATNKFAAVSEYGFNVGYAGDFQGGQLSDAFVTNTLSGAAYIGIKNTGTTDVKLNQVILYAAGANDNFVIRQELDAKAIKAANNVAANVGTNFYLGQPKETSKTIVTTYSSVKTLTASTADPSYVVLPVLPATISDLKILLVDENSKVAIVDCGKQEIKALASGDYSVKKLVDLKDVEFKTDYIVTDAASLASVLTAVSALQDVSETNPIKVQVIGDVTLNATTTIGDADFYKFVTFEGGKIIVPADKTLTIAKGTTVNTDIDVMDKGCCGTADGKLIAETATLGGVINNRGDIEVGDGSAANLVVMNDATLNNLKGTETIRGAKTEYEGSILVKAKTTLTLNGTSSILNEGTMMTKGTGKSAEDGTITLPQGSTATIDNQNSIVNGGNINILSSANGLKNSTTTSEFVDKVGSQLTGYGMNSDNQGEFICEVDAQNRYETALKSNIRPTTIVRFVDVAQDKTDSNNNVTGEYMIGNGDIKNVATGDFVSFEIAAETQNDEIKFIKFADTDAVSTIKSLTVTSAKSVDISKLLKVNEDANFDAANITSTINADFVVVRNINVNKGNVAVAEKKNVNASGSECNMTVAKDGSIAFANDGKSYFNVITNNGSVDITVATTSPKVAHEVWCKSFTTGADGKWTNNSYPLIY